MSFGSVIAGISKDIITGIIWGVIAGIIRCITTGIVWGIIADIIRDIFTGIARGSYCVYHLGYYDGYRHLVTHVLRCYGQYI